MRCGTTDDYRFEAIDHPVQIHDLHATIQTLLGLNPETNTFRHAGRDFRLSDVDGRVIKELIA